MYKIKVIYFVVFLLAYFSKGEGVEYEPPSGYHWITRDGTLYIYAGEPPKYLRYYESHWQEHSWLVHKQQKPENIELVPLRKFIKKQIVEEINLRRAKTLLGAYFDPERPTGFGVIPPAAHLSTVKYNEDVAGPTQRFVQHGIFDHHIYDEIFPDVPSGEILRQYYRYAYKDDDESLETLGQSTLNISESVLIAFKSMFDRELQYYRHFEPYTRSASDDLLDKHFKEAIREDDSLTEKVKEWKLQFETQYGHATSIIAKNMHRVGCALSRKTTERGPREYEGNWREEYEFEFLLGCKLGGGLPQTGKSLYELDENLLHLHGASKSLYDPPKT